MNGLEDCTGQLVAVELVDGHRFAAKLVSVQGGQATLEARSGWRSSHPVEDIRRWRPVCKRRRA
jgi:hypothetical protein